MLKRERKIKIIVMFTIMLCIMWMSGAKTFAQTVNESEPNDSKETAQLIQANRETALQAATGNRTDQYFVNEGNTSLNDIDWYKVLLSKGTQYVICNGFDFDFWVYDENNNILLNQSYSKISSGSRSYAFKASTDGYYYVKVQGITSSSTNYILGVGEHTYGIAHCQVNLGSVNMTDNSDFIKTFDLSNNDSIPDGAIVYDMFFEGLRTSNARYAIINNKTQNYKNTLGPTIYSIYNIAARGLKVKSDWELTIGCVKNKTINPKFTMFFVYPVFSDFLYNNEIIINAY